MTVGTPDSDKRVSQGKDYEICRAGRGPFEILRLHGKCTGPLLAELRDKHLKPAREVALDVGGLAGAGVPFVRELVLSARRFRNVGHYLVLLNARGPLRDLLHSSGDGLVPIAVSERMFEGDVEEFLKRLREARRQIGLLRADVENNPAWHLVDREQCWLCPFCGRIQSHLRLDLRQGLHDVHVEKIWIHLEEDCPEHRAGQGIKSLSDLTDSLRRSNLEKIRESRTTATALATRVIELQDRVKEAEELEESVRVAGVVQRYLLPARVPEIPGIAAALGYWPANRVGGDFYDFLDMGEGRFAMLIGDVGGHGVEASVLMGVAKKVISLRMSDTSDVRVALQMANRDLYPDLNRRTLVSAFLGVFDSVSRELSYVRAGHNPPILYHPERSPQFVKLEAPGLALGLDAGARFNQGLVQEALPLRCGDSLLFYTDGVVEAQNPSGEEFGLQRLYDELRRNGSSDPQELIDALYERLEAFREGLPQEDDVTAFLLRLTA